MFMLNKMAKVAYLVAMRGLLLLSKVRPILPTFSSCSIGLTYLWVIGESVIGMVGLRICERRGGVA